MNCHNLCAVMLCYNDNEMIDDRMNVRLYQSNSEVCAYRFGTGLGWGLYDGAVYSMCGV